MTAGKMRILMLGWEFPPYIAGGLGTACFGLTRALDRLGHEVIFILPRPVDRSLSSHVRLLSPEALVSTPPSPRRRSRPFAGERPAPEGPYVLSGFERVEFHGVEASFTSPYPRFEIEEGSLAALEGASPPEGGGDGPGSGRASPGAAGGRWRASGPGGRTMPATSSGTPNATRGSWSPWRSTSAST